MGKSYFAAISRIAELIIPKTDTAGVIEAGVPEYIDLVVSRDTDQQLTMADGLRWLDSGANRIAGQRFIELTERRQLAILESPCEAFEAKDARARNIQFFALMKSLTAHGYYTSQAGLIKELGYGRSGIGQLSGLHARTQNLGRQFVFAREKRVGALKKNLARGVER